MHDDQSFEQRLYDQMCAVFPETTVRSFSAALGKSAGYWSSVCAQGLKASNAALLHLMDHLECKKIRLDASSARRQGVEKIQKQITAELLSRLKLQLVVTSEHKTSLKEVEESCYVCDQPLPFVMSLNRF
jgi:hypothetical protein